MKHKIVLEYDSETGIMEVHESCSQVAKMFMLESYALKQLSDINSRKEETSEEDTNGDKIIEIMKNMKG